ncbi:MAG: BrnT family toxin [Beijerinckiaceae bacterium]
MEFAGFDWDKGNRDKCRKHGVSIDEIESLFAGVVLVSPDPEHSEKEERLKAFGTTARWRKLLVAFTLRHKGKETFIRPISARYMHQKEADYYEKETSHVEK